MVGSYDNDEVLDTKGAARFVSGKLKKPLSPATLERLRCVGGGPVFVKIGGSRVGYFQSDLVSWLRAKRRTSTSDPGNAA